MEMTREEAHDLKNQLAIAIGMVEISIRHTKKDEIDMPKIIEKLEKSLVALKKMNAFFIEKEKGDKI